MPFPDLTTNGMVALEDSSKFQEQRIDPALIYQTEGGVFLSRPRYTRDPGVSITTGFTHITEADKEILDAYYKTNLGGSYSFNYVHPTTGATLVVRFLKPYKSQYVGLGGYHYWDITEITMQTV